MEIISTALKRKIRPARVPPQPTLEPVASQLPSLFVQIDLKSPELPFDTGQVPEQART